jgi:hypothetical protein
LGKAILFSKKVAGFMQSFVKMYPDLIFSNGFEFREAFLLNFSKFAALIKTLVRDKERMT